MTDNIDPLDMMDWYLCYIMGWIVLVPRGGLRLLALPVYIVTFPIIVLGILPAIIITAVWGLIWYEGDRNE